MPVELHPTLNRRLFLSQAGAAVGGLALGTVLQAGVETAAPAELEAGWLAQTWPRPIWAKTWPRTCARLCKTF